MITKDQYRELFEKSFIRHAREHGLDADIRLAAPIADALSDMLGILCKTDDEVTDLLRDGETTSIQ